MNFSKQYFVLKLLFIFFFISNFNALKAQSINLENVKSNYEKLLPNQKINLLETWKNKSSSVEVPKNYLTQFEQFLNEKKIDIRILKKQLPYIKILFNSDLLKEERFFYLEMLHENEDSSEFPLEIIDANKGNIIK